jgi:hypothetical protein
MKRLLLLASVVALLLPAAATATRPPTKAQLFAAKNAAWTCKALQTTMGRSAFIAAYGANKKARGAGAMRNAYGKCVAQKKKKLLAAALFESANGTLSVSTPTPTPPGTIKTLNLTGTLTGARPIASGNLTGALSVDMSKAVTKHHATCAPATGTITLSQASPAGTLVKTLANAVYCTNSIGSALVGRYILTGTGAFATATGVGTEVLLANTSGTMHSIEFGTLSQ